MEDSGIGDGGGGVGRGAARGGRARLGRPVRIVGGGSAEYSGMFFSMFF